MRQRTFTEGIGRRTGESPTEAVIASVTVGTETGDALIPNTLKQVTP
jgi:hypothetical protein